MFVTFFVTVIVQLCPYEIFFITHIIVLQFSHKCLEKLTFVLFFIELGGFYIVFGMVTVSQIWQPCLMLQATCIPSRKHHIQILYWLSFTCIMMIMYFGCWLVLILCFPFCFPFQTLLLSVFMFQLLRTVGLRAFSMASETYTSGTHSAAFVTCPNDTVAKELARWVKQQHLLLVQVFDFIQWWKAIV